MVVLLALSSIAVHKYLLYSKIKKNYSQSLPPDLTKTSINGTVQQFICDNYNQVYKHTVSVIKY